jgi:tRNA (guanine10-N2)-methyltransferase
VVFLTRSSQTLLVRVDVEIRGTYLISPLDGVRAGAKRLGLRDKPLKPDRPPPSVATHDPATRIPPTKPYELADLAMDLVVYARFLLKTRGRLVFFLPTVNDEYSDVDIPRIDGMQLVSNSLQDYGSWGRRASSFEY